MKIKLGAGVSGGGFMGPTRARTRGRQSRRAGGCQLPPASGRTRLVVRLEWLHRLADTKRSPAALSGCIPPLLMTTGVSTRSIPVAPCFQTRQRTLWCLTFGQDPRAKTRSTCTRSPHYRPHSPKYPPPPKKNEGLEENPISSKAQWYLQTR